MDWVGLVAVVMVFGTGMVGTVAFSPIGRAIANAIQKKSGVTLAPEVQDALAEQADRLEALQQQVAELAERQDFAERMLAKAREQGKLPAGGAS
ncbi:MAG TPA: hypothetical protein VLZ06_02775 [Solirubrobacteraceae bacterium]|nr:hypothetical protein [Solirubrobacteraceae bacterium]